MRLDRRENETVDGLGIRWSFTDGEHLTTRLWTSVGNGQNVVLAIESDTYISTPMAKPKKRSLIPSVASGPSKWFLIQTRIDPSYGRQVRALAKKEGLPSSAYLRRLVIQHLESINSVESAEPEVSAPSLVEST